MMSWMAGLLALTPFSNFLNVVTVLSILVPSFIIYMYKTTVYVEDMLYGLNEMNGMLMFLTISLALLVYLSSSYFKASSYGPILFLLVIAIMLCFSMADLLLFYIFFEISLLPIFIMLLGWGYQPERLQAGLYMIFYTVFGSLPLFFLILFLGSNMSTYGLYFMWNVQVEFMNWLFYIGFFAFMIKLPIWSLHVWLPKAHVEAPLGGSMMLAGALLKLGGYGLYIYNMIGVTSLLSTLGVAWLFVAMWGGLCASLICLSQSDIKGMIAYSSIVHMSLVVLGILSNTTWGSFCALMTMVAHGWASSALFMCAFITYEKVGSRSFNYTKGILTGFPMLGFFWFLFCSTNMAVPPSINLMGELAAIPVAFSLSASLLLVLLLIMFMSVTYNMYMYIKINHGSKSWYITSGVPVSSRWFLIMTGHLFPLIFLFNMDMMSLYTVNCM